MTRELETILDVMVEGVVLVGPAGRVVRMNPAARTMLNWPLPPGQHFLELVRAPSVVAVITAALAGEAPAPVEVALDVRGLRLVSAHAVPVAADQGGGAVLVLRDVTAVRRLEAMRRDFVTNVSHELRTPLTAVRGYLEALRETPEVPAPQRQKFLDIMERHTQRMERLVRDLLRLARLDSGQDAIDAARLTVPALVASVEHDLESVLAARRQRVVLTVADDVPTITGDFAKLSDALRNVVENACHYGPEGSAIEVAATLTGDTVVITVSDRGPGIHENDLPRIFERFYRADRSRSVDPGGTGLGLSIARHLVELHGGRITAANRAGGGATVTISIPATCPDRSARS